MMASNPLKTILRGDKPDRMPIWLMRQAGRYLPEYNRVRSRLPDFLSLCYTPSLAAEVTLQPVRRFDLDAAIVFSDILVIPHGLGQPVRFEAGEGPVLEPLEESDPLSGLRPDGLVEALAPVYETLALVRTDLPETVDLIGFAGAPWTLAAYMVEGRSSRDFAVAKRFAFSRPELFDRLIEMLTEAVGRHLEAQAAAGAQVLQLFDSWAGLLPDWAFKRWVIQPAARLRLRLTASVPEVPLICFPRLAGERYGDFVGRVAPAGLSLDTGVSLTHARRHLADRACLQGNLDPVLLLVGGAAMRRGADRILTELADKPLIFNLGHGVLPQTDPSHVADLVDHVHEQGQARGT